MEATAVLQPGVAYIKPEFILSKTSREELLAAAPSTQPDDLNKDTSPSNAGQDEEEEEEVLSKPPPAKRKRRRGQNKHRPRSKIPFSEMLCPSLHVSSSRGGAATCPFGDKCHYMHDVAQYMLTKPPDIADTCYNFETFGKCPFGPACRFASSHLNSNYENLVNKEIFESSDRVHTLNVLSKSLQENLRKRTVEYPESDAYLDRLASTKDDTCQTIPALQHSTEAGGTEASGTPGCSSATEDKDRTSAALSCGPLTDEDGIKLRAAEKKQVEFRDRLYLAPLTTVGNLPFRRICKELGADITCGEMAMATNLLQGQQSEWALIKRHESEDLFGVQVCGSHANTMTRCAELINRHAQVDFVDINTGCPLDLICNKGAGCALMGRHTRFESIVRGMVTVLDCPLTVKMRAGLLNKSWNAHLLAPKLRDWGVSLVSIHGRSREQRYTRHADWSYINDCVQVAAPLPIFGNGDILSFHDYNRFRSETEVAGTMIARGALVKPWIFTEIKEQRDWDISSSERFDILRRYTNYGLQHWGSDTQGVENTRRFLLEWLSFLYRYIPVGVLERVPQRLNERPPLYHGRDHLETLMASNNCRHWIQISEMLLGPVPPNFTFLPKHKANAY